MYQGTDNENGFIPFALMRDLKNVRDPDEFHSTDCARTEQEGADGRARSDRAAAPLRS